MGIEDLNQDVLRLVLLYLNSTDAHRLSSTSRALRNVAREQVVRDVTLCSSLHQIIAFCEYMLSDAHDLLQLLHTLRIQVFTDQWIMREHQLSGDPESLLWARGAVLLADLLLKVSTLHTFSLHYTEVWMNLDPRIVTAVSSIRHLKEIEFKGFGERAMDTLCTLRSAPTKLRLSDLTVSSRPLSCMDTAGLSLPLASVRTLSIRAFLFLPGAHPFARIFPNVREVDFGYDSRTSSVNEWPSLETVRGATSQLRYWANMHPIHCLELLRRFPKTDGTRFETLASDGPNVPQERADALDVVTNLQPVALLATLSTRLGHRYLRRLFTVSQRLRYVCAEVWDVRRYRTWLADLTPWLSVLREALHHLRLQGREIVCLTVRCSILPEEHSYNRPKSSDPEDSPKSYAKAREGVIDLMRQWASSVPTICYLSLEAPPATRNHHANVSDSKRPGLCVEDYESFWWKIDRDGDVHTVTPIHPEQGTQITRFLCSPRYHWDEDLDPQLREAAPRRHLLQ